MSLFPMHKAARAVVSLCRTPRVWLRVYSRKAPHESTVLLLDGSRATLKHPRFDVYDIKNDRSHTCVTLNASEFEHQQTSAANALLQDTTTSRERIVELLLVHDLARVQQFEQLGLNALEHGLELAALTDMLWFEGTEQQEVNIIRVVLSGQLTRSTVAWDAPQYKVKDGLQWKPIDNIEDVKTMLRAIRNWHAPQFEANALPRHDVAHVLSGAGLPFVLAGMAFANAMASPGAVGVIAAEARSVSQLATDTSLVAAALAHEIGHNIGLKHDASKDDNGNGCAEAAKQSTIMSPELDGASRLFSNCSHKELNALLEDLSSAAALATLDGVIPGDGCTANDIDRVCRLSGLFGYCSSGNDGVFCRTCDNGPSCGVIAAAANSCVRPTCTFGRCATVPVNDGTAPMAVLTTGLVLDALASLHDAFQKVFRERNRRLGEQPPEEVAGEGEGSTKILGIAVRDFVAITVGAAFILCCALAALYTKRRTQSARIVLRSDDLSERSARTSRVKARRKKNSAQSTNATTHEDEQHLPSAPPQRMLGGGLTSQGAYDLTNDVLPSVFRAASLSSDFSESAYDTAFPSETTRTFNSFNSMENSDDYSTETQLSANKRTNDY
ncbi:MAG: hypothetical protein MHM6MM_004428 [Cercozoa sp. M6MM]